jgi:acyl-CoA thioesterase
MATAVTAGAEPGAWEASVPDSWNVPTGMHGGVLAATALRAAGEQMDEPAMPLRSAHVSFLARPEGQSLVLQASVLRRGGTTAHVDVTARSAGADRDAVSVRAMFARSHGGEGWLDARMPAVPEPWDLDDDAVVARGGFPMPMPPIFDQLDRRTAGGGFRPDGHGMGPDVDARHLIWTRYRDADGVTRPDGAFDPLALLPPADLPGAAVWARGPGPDGFRVMLSMELTAWFLEPATEPWVLTDARARWLGDGYVLAECDCWSNRRLVARVEQIMLVRHLPV